MLAQVLGLFALTPADLRRVLKTYLADFHGVTLGFYKKQREELYKPARPIAAGHRAMDLGLAPFVPHLSHYSHRLRPRPYEDWMALDLAFVEVCDILWRLPGDSPGADREVAHARSRGIPVVSSFDALAGWLALFLTQRLGASPATVKKHLEHVYEKLGVETRTAAAAP